MIQIDTCLLSGKSFIDSDVYLFPLPVCLWTLIPTRDRLITPLGFFPNLAKWADIIWLSLQCYQVTDRIRFSASLYTNAIQCRVLKRKLVVFMFYFSELWFRILAACLISSHLYHLIRFCKRLQHVHFISLNLLFAEPQLTLRAYVIGQDRAVISTLAAFLFQDWEVGFLFTEQCIVKLYGSSRLIGLKILHKNASLLWPACIKQPLSWFLPFS